MLIIAMGWLFVVALYALAHGSAPGGTWLGALLLLLLGGVLPVALLVYVTLGRARGRLRREAAALRASGESANPDGGGHAAGDPSVASMREEP